MSLTYQTLDGETVDRVAVAIDRVRLHVRDGCRVAFSGGKDSIAAHEIVRLSGVPYAAHYNVTTVDPPEVVAFIREHYPEVVFDRPRISMFRLIEKKHCPPTRMVRYCCAELKERNGRGETVVTGVRSAESPKRSGRLVYETCKRDGVTHYLNPIVDWSEADVWAFIRSRGLPYPALYDEGFARLGCIMCPLQGEAGMRRDAARWPRTYRAYLRAFGRMIAIDQKRPRSPWTWRTADEVAEWWMSGKQPDRDTVQIDLDEIPVGCFGEVTD